MADSRSFVKPPHFSSQERQVNRSITTQKSFAHVLSPNFINQTILTKFWELVHLLFIGIAISYGLFSRRNAEVDFETPSGTFDDSQSSYVSRIFHVSPIFEDGCENPCGFDEKNVYPYQIWNSQFYRGESGVVVPNNSSVIDEQSKIGSLNSENGTTEISLENDENRVAQAWSSQYFQAESMVVLSEANYAIDDWGRHEQVVGCRPLGLPVRSLKPRVRKAESSQFSNNGNEPGSSFIGSFSSSVRNTNENNFGDMDPVNLEEKFDESFSLPSEIPGQSRSGRTEMWGKVGPVANVPSNFRPLSVDETKFESLKSHSFRSTTSLSSQASSVSNSPIRLSPSHSASSDSPNSRREESGKEKDFSASYPPASQSPQATVNREARLNAFHLRRYSSGSLFQKDVHKTLKDELKDLRGKRREDLSLSSKQRAQGPLKSDKKPATIVKVSPKGKSVRTIRSGVYTADALKAGDKNTTQIDEQVGEGSNDAKAVKIEKNEMKREVLDNMSNGINKQNLDNRWKIESKKEELDNMSVGINKKNVDTRYDMPNMTHSKYQNKEKKELLENVTVETTEESGSDTDNGRVSSGEDAKDASVSDAGHDPNEVDKKAGEFIAKFREQIRLQKVASIDRPRGMRLSGKHLR
ncbi:hypothetical protein JCGZ_14600 [Jatropha curcas]|uniref:Uncharacterized protein n=1 Tax=Jatropha curcas TaxID=180498 RepID=A0A067KAJ0_JATCU|nr:hypothetical protein JCGZ_14600 [Jatropha curcas]